MFPFVLGLACQIVQTNTDFQFNFLFQDTSLPYISKLWSRTFTHFPKLICSVPACDNRNVWFCGHLFQHNEKLMIKIFNLFRF